MMAAARAGNAHLLLLLLIETAITTAALPLPAQKTCGTYINTAIERFQGLDVDGRDQINNNNNLR